MAVSLLIPSLMAYGRATRCKRRRRRRPGKQRGGGIMGTILKQLAIKTFKTAAKEAAKGAARGAARHAAKKTWQAITSRRRKRPS